MKRAVFCLMVAAALALTSGGAGFSRQQDAAQLPLDPKPIRIEVLLVNLLVTVNSKRGSFVTDLTREDFRIFEDDTPQAITNFSSDTNLPLTIALLVDTSSSVKLKLDFEKDAATDFIYTVMRPQDRAMLLEFDTGVTLLQDLTSNPNEIVREIKKLKASGGTSMYDAIYLVSEEKLLHEQGRKAIVILSDGADQTSRYKFDEALEMARSADAVIYAVSTARYGASVDAEGENALKQLAEETGGRLIVPYSPDDIFAKRTLRDQLERAFRQISEELRSQYSISYSSTNQARDGRYRKIKVKIARDDLHIRHKKGYIARPTSS